MRYALHSMIFLAAAGVAAAGVAAAGAQNINPATQISWPKIAGAGTPSAIGVVCSAANVGQPYQNTAVTPNGNYTCANESGSYVWEFKTGAGGGTVTAVTATYPLASSGSTAPVISQSAPMYFPEQFGALGGSHNDTTAIQTMFNTVLGNGTIYFDQTYKVCGVYIPMNAGGLVIQGLQTDTPSLAATSGCSSPVLKVYSYNIGFNNFVVNGENTAPNGIVFASAAGSNATNVSVSYATGDEVQFNPNATPTTTLTSNITSGTTTFTVANAALAGMTLGTGTCSNLLIDNLTASGEEKVGVSGSGNTMTTAATWATTHNIGATVQCAGNNDNMVLTNLAVNSSSGGWGINIFSAEDNNAIHFNAPQMGGNSSGGMLVSGSGTVIDQPHAEANGGPAIQLGDLDGGQPGNVISPYGGNGRASYNTIITPFPDNESNTPNGVTASCEGASNINTLAYQIASSTCSTITVPVNSVQTGPTVEPGTGNAVWAVQDGGGTIVSHPAAQVLRFYNHAGTLLNTLGLGNVSNPSGLGGPVYLPGSLTTYSIPNYVGEISGSANNALKVLFQDPTGANVPLTSGAPPSITMTLAHSLQAGVNTINVNGTTYGIHSNINLGGNLFNPISAGAIITLTWNNGSGAWVVENEWQYYTLPSTVVQTNQANTYSTGLQDFSSATMKQPSNYTVGSYIMTQPGAAGTLALTSQLPSVGTWGALNYPTWSSGAPFVKMTAAGTFALDTNTYDAYGAASTAQSNAETYAANASNLSSGTVALARMAQSNTSTSGYLSSTDWNTFNGKQAALGFTPYNATNPAGYITSSVTTLPSLSLPYSQLTGTPAIPSVGTWGALNYPSWSSGAPFVKMTAAGTFALDTSTYLTSLSGALLATGATTGATSQAQVFTDGVTTNVANTFTGLQIDNYNNPGGSSVGGLSQTNSTIGASSNAGANMYFGIFDAGFGTSFAGLNVVSSRNVGNTNNNIDLNLQTLEGGIIVRTALNAKSVTGDVSINTSSDLGYALGVNGTFYSSGAATLPAGNTQNGNAICDASGAGCPGGTVYNAGGTQQTAAHTVIGTGDFNTYNPYTVNFSGAAAFSSSSSYACTATSSGTFPVNFNSNASSSITFYLNGTVEVSTPFYYICIGN
jgi:hypothetical protein